MNKPQLSVQPRTILGRKVKTLRSQALVPANIFGKKIPSLNVQLNTKDFQKVYREVGESTLLYLQVEGEKENRPVLVSQVIYPPTSAQILHIAFHQVDLKQKVTVPVSVKLTGEAPAEKDGLGILVQQQDEVEIEGLPTDMPDHLDADVTSLTEVNQAIYALDVKLSAKLVLKTNPETIIAKIEPLAKEEKVEAPPVEAAPTEGGGETPTPTETTEQTKPEAKPNA